jgi:hypothetical protein
MEEDKKKMKTPKTVFGNMHNLFSYFCFLVLLFSLVLVFKTVCQTHINGIKICFAILKTEKLFPK